MGDEQRLSEEGLEMLSHMEGTVLHVYMDQAGVQTVGTGHALTAQEKASGAFAGGITREEAKSLLRADVAQAEAAVARLVKVQLGQAQFDALVDFTFNLGVGAFESSTLLHQLNAGNYAAVPLELVRWDKRRDPRTGALVEDAGLLKRRQAEAALWENGYGHQDTVAAVRVAAEAAFSRNFTTGALLGDSDFAAGSALPADEIPPTDRNS